MRVPLAHPCHDHNCDGCRVCRLGRCCGRDRGQGGAPVVAKKPPKTPVPVGVAEEEPDAEDRSPA